jgi:hypothetical protein
VQHQRDEGGGQGRLGLAAFAVAQRRSRRRDAAGGVGQVVGEALLLIGSAAVAQLRQRGVNDRLC